MTQKSHLQGLHVLGPRWSASKTKSRHLLFWSCHGPSLAFFYARKRQRWQRDEHLICRGWLNLHTHKTKRNTCKTIHFLSNFRLENEKYIFELCSKWLNFLSVSSQMFHLSSLNRYGISNDAKRIQKSCCELISIVTVKFTSICLPVLKTLSNDDVYFKLN